MKPALCILAYIASLGSCEHCTAEKAVDTMKIWAKQNPKFELGANLKDPAAEETKFSAAVTRVLAGAALYAKKDDNECDKTRGLALMLGAFYAVQPLSLLNETGMPEACKLPAAVEHALLDALVRSGKVAGRRSLGFKDVVCKPTQSEYESFQTSLRPQLIALIRACGDTRNAAFLASLGQFNRIPALTVQALALGMEIEHSVTWAEVVKFIKLAAKPDPIKSERQTRVEPATESNRSTYVPEVGGKNYLFELLIDSVDDNDCAYLNSSTAARIAKRQKACQILRATRELQQNWKSFRKRNEFLIKSIGSLHV